MVIDFTVFSCQFYAAFLYKTDRQLTRQEKLENLAGGEINIIFFFLEGSKTFILTLEK